MKRKRRMRRTRWRRKVAEEAKGKGSARKRKVDDGERAGLDDDSAFTTPKRSKA